MKESRRPWWFRKKAELSTLSVPNDYTIISSVGKGLVELLRMNLVPNIVNGNDDIGLCDPQEHGDCVLAVYLYDMSENNEMRINGMQDLGEELQKYPSMYIDLYYMITAISSIELRYRAEENQRIMASVLQIFHDNPVINQKTMLPSETAGYHDLFIQLLNLSFEEKARIWGNRSNGMPLSLFYKITPVELESMVTKQVKRVKEIQYNSGSKGLWEEN